MMVTIRPIAGSEEKYSHFFSWPLETLAVIRSVRKIIDQELENPIPFTDEFMNLCSIAIEHIEILNNKKLENRMQKFDDKLSELYNEALKIKEIHRMKLGRDFVEESKVEFLDDDRITRLMEED